MSSKHKFTTYTGGAAMAVNPEKSPELLKDPARTYGDAPKGIAASRIDYVRVYPTQPVAQTQAIGSNFEALLELHDVVMNFSKMRLMYDLQIDAQGAGTYIWHPADVHSIISGFDLIGSISGSCYAEVRKSFAPLVQKVIQKRDIARSDYECMEKKDALYKSKLAPSLNYLGFTPTVDEPNTALANQLTAATPLTEPQYYKCSAAANAVYPYAAGFERQEVTFGRWCRSGVMGINKNLYLGEALRLRVYFDTSKIGHSGTSPTNPMVGAAALTGNITIKNVMVYEPQEQDPGAKAQAIAELTSGKVIPVPWIKTDFITLQNSNQQPKMLFQPADGTFLRRVLVAPFRGNRAANTLFDHSNYCPGTVIDGTGGGKFRQFYTSLDGDKLQKDYVDCVPANPSGNNMIQLISQDWLIQRPFLEHSVIQDLEMFRKNWSWEDSFIGTDNPLNEVPTDALGGVKVAGGSAAGRTWQLTTDTIQGTIAGATTYPNLQWLIVGELTRYLALKPGGSAVVPYMQQPVTAIPSLPAAQTVPSA